MPCTLGNREHASKNSTRARINFELITNIARLIYPKKKPIDPHVTISVEAIRLEAPLLFTLRQQDYFDARQTLADKVMRASNSAGGAGAGGVGAASPSPGTFFNFGERARENQKAKLLAKINTPHKRYEKKVRQAGDCGGVGVFLYVQLVPRPALTMKYPSTHP